MLFVFHIMWEGREICQGSILEIKMKMFIIIITEKLKENAKKRKTNLL